MRIIATIILAGLTLACGAAPQQTTPPSVLRSEIVTPPLPAIRTPPEFAAPDCGKLRSDEAGLKRACARETLAGGTSTGPKCQALDAAQAALTEAKCD